MPTENLHYRPLYIRNNPPSTHDSGEQQVWVVMRSRKEKVTPKGIAAREPGATTATSPAATLTATGRDDPGAISPATSASAARGTRLYGYEVAQSLVPEFFMPMKERVATRGGRQIRTVAPAIPDIFFVRDTPEHLNSIVNADNGIEYLYVKGQPYRQPVVVRDSEMENFIAATTSSQRVTFHTAASDTLSHLIGRRVRITAGGTAIEGELLTIRGSRRRRLRVSLPASHPSLTTLTAYIDLTLPPDALIENLD